MKTKRVLLASILIIGIFIMSGFVIQQTDAKTKQEEIAELNQKIEEKKTKIKELETSIETYKKNIEEKKLETVSLRNQLDIIDNHIARIQADIELTDEKIKKTQLEKNILKFS